MYILICDDEPAVARQVEQLARQHLEQRGIPVPVHRLHPGRGGAGPGRTWPSTSWPCWTWTWRP